MLTNSSSSYGLVSRAFHGLLLLLIVAMLAIGIVMTDLDRTDELRKQLFSLHFSTGVLVLIVTVLRVIWLWISPAPALPAGLGKGEKILTKLVKSLMYLLMVAIPVAGLLMVNAAGHPVTFFGLFQMPVLVGKSRQLHGLMGDLHSFMAYTLLALIVLHVVGALKHRFFDSPDADVLSRMYGRPDRSAAVAVQPLDG